MATHVGALAAQPLAREQSATGARVIIVDALRGLALLAMALDHASFFVGVGLQAESYGGAAVILQSMPYWMSGLLTNIAAPIFWLLSGTSLALYEAGRRTRGDSDGPISSFFLVRAVVVLALDLSVCALAWRGAYPYVHVLTSMAVAMAMLAGLRLLPTPLLTAVGLGALLGYQGWLLSAGPTLAEATNLGDALLRGFSYQTIPALGFPVLGWGPLMWLGFCLGRVISLPWQRPTPRVLLLAGLGLTSLALCLRLLGGYGDFAPFGQVGDTPAHWLIMSKAPPSLSFFAFNLGLAGLFAAALMARPGWLARAPLSWLTSIGQASLCFYVVHLWVYSLLARIIVPLNLPLIGLVRGYLAFSLGLIILLPLCSAYGRLRRSRAIGFLRYL